MHVVFNEINAAICNFLGINGYIQGVVVMVCFNIIAVLGMSVLTGFTRLFSFGNAGFMAIGAYACAIFCKQLGMNFIVAIILGSLFAGFVAYLLGSITLRLKGDYFLITCLGFGECVRVLFNYTKNLTGGSAGYVGIPAFSNMTFSIICVVLAFYIAWRFIHSKYGRNLTAIRENELAAEAVGVNAYKTKRMSFTFSAIYAGWAGALYAGHLMYIVPSAFGLAKSTELITTTVIGGLGSLTGSVMAAIIVTVLPEIFRGLSTYRMLIYAVAVVLIIMFKPSGLYGYKEFSLKRFIANIKKLFKGKKAAAAVAVEGPAENTVKEDE